MTYGNEQRRRRSAASSRRDEVEEADAWLAGIRPTRSSGAQPDPFAAPPQFDEDYGQPTFEPPPPPPPPAPPPGGGGRRRAREDEPGSGEFYRGSPGGDYDPTTRAGRRRAREAEETGSFASPIAPAPVDRWSMPSEPPQQQAQAIGSARDSVPELVPIMKPISSMPTPEAPPEPPPLVPIFPNLGQPKPPRRPRPRPSPGRAAPEQGRPAAPGAGAPGVPQMYGAAGMAAPPAPPMQARPADRPVDYRDRTGEVRRPRGMDPSGEHTGTGVRAAGLRPPTTPYAPGRPGGPGAPMQPGGPASPGRQGGPGRPGTRPRTVVDPVKLPAAHRPHRWVAALSVLGALVLVAACSLGTWFIVKDERQGPEEARRAGASQGPQSRDISSRTVDPALLTEAEVFPTNNIIAAPNEPPYVILKTYISEDCKTGAADDLGTLLVDAGCNQVVRATMKSPTEEYLITAGLFNLTDEASAERAFNGVKPIIDSQKGRFTGMSAGAGTGTDAIVRAPTQLGWNFRGHFIAYCVIARTDGQPFAANDPYPGQITFDIVETYLENGIIGARATVQEAPTPAASLPPPSPGG